MSKHQGFVRRYEAVTVAADVYFDACMEAKKLAKQGVIRLVFLHGQERAAREWEIARSCGETVSVLALLQSGPPPADPG